MNILPLLLGIALVGNDLSYSSVKAEHPPVHRLQFKPPLSFERSNGLPFPLPEQTSPHSTGKSFLKSLLVPGWGEFSSGAKLRARTFLIAEGILWGSFAAFQIYGHWRGSDLESFAVFRAQVNKTGKDKSFYTDVSNYRDIYEYNEEKRRFRRYEEVYPVDEDHFWQWRKEEDRRRFESLLTSRDLAFRNATLIIGAILVNHLISAVDAVWVSHQANKKLSSHLHVFPEMSLRGEISLMISLSTRW